nr:BTAD domain-containing putative transcriptional regulator [Herpetosiphon giganteus]
MCWKLYAELPEQQSALLQLLGLYGSAASIERLLEVVKQASTQQRKIAQQSLTSIRQRPAYALKIQLFGSLQLWRGSELVDANEWAREKARQLLALLLLQRPRIISREAVIEQLWPELAPQAADGALRVTLNALLHVLEPERSGGANSAFILSEAAGLRLNPQATITTDYAQFQSLLQTAAQHRQQGAMPAALHAYQTALAIYQDDLLSDLAYAEWVLDWREQALTQFVSATSEYLELLLAYGPTAEAIPYAERLLSYDPYHEPTYQRLIDIYLMLGNVSAAERIRKRLERISL